MSDEEKQGHHFDLPLLAPGGLNVDMSVFKLLSCKPGASRELVLRPIRLEF